MTDLSRDFVVLLAGMEGLSWQYDIFDEKQLPARIGKYRSKH